MLKINIESKKYNTSNFTIKDFTLEIEDSQCVCLIGLNGAGKSTILNCISSVENIDRGQIILDGIKSNDKNYINNLGFSLNKSLLVETMTPIEFLMFHLILIEKNIDKIKIKELLSLFFEEDKFNEKINAFSLGMKKKLEICTALISSPKLLIFDEPFNGLDFISSQKLVSIIVELKKRGKIIVIAMHNIDNINKICDSAVILNNGNKMDEIPINKLFSFEEIEKKILEYVDFSYDNTIENILPEWI